MVIWGHKELAAFDIWSIAHFLSGISFGVLLCTRMSSAVVNLPKRDLYRYHFYRLLFFTYLWEVVEHYLEVGLLGDKVAYWFHGVEYWSNRIITDPILVVLGYVIVYRFPKIGWPARILSIVFLFFHVVIFPHSMYLHVLASGSK
jgi:hypothetical protein